MKGGLGGGRVRRLDLPILRVSQFSCKPVGHPGEVMNEEHSHHSGNSDNRYCRACVVRGYLGLISALLDHLHGAG